MVWDVRSLCTSTNVPTDIYYLLYLITWNSVLTRKQKTSLFSALNQSHVLTSSVVVHVKKYCKMFDTTKMLLYTATPNIVLNNTFKVE